MRPPRQPALSAVHGEPSRWWDLPLFAVVLRCGHEVRDVFFVPGRFPIAVHASLSRTHLLLRGVAA